MRELYNPGMAAIESAYFSIFYYQGIVVEIYHRITSGIDHPQSN